MLARVPVPLLLLDVAPLWLELHDLVRSLPAGANGVAAYLDRHREVVDHLAARTAATWANPAAVALYGAPSAAALLPALPTLLGDHWDRLHREIAVAFAAGTTPTLSYVARHTTYQGRQLHVRITVQVPDSTSTPEQALLSVVDLTEEVERERLHELVSEGLGAHTGKGWLREAVAFIGTKLSADLSFIAQVDGDGDALRPMAVFQDGAPTTDFRCPVTSAACDQALNGGEVAYVEDLSRHSELDPAFAQIGARTAVVAPVVDGNGKKRGVVGAVYRLRPSDTAHVRSTLKLLASRAVAELERATQDAKQVVLEEQLVHAQRLESVGRLAGGIAHDFNNLLAPILAYAEMAVDALPEDEPSREDVAEIIGAAERATRVTRKLLAFSRRQVLDIHTLDLNAVLLSFTRLIRTVIREDIHLALDLSEGPAPISADEGQVEQILMNLILNAQDAMPGGGHLKIRTRRHDVEGSEPELSEGAYVCLEVSDTGTGMDEGTLALIFEPFFTTKEPNEGTGLGLAMVYGIMHQHGGAVKVDSEPGGGTTFRLYFPASDEMSEGACAEAASHTRPTGSERILVVEDETVVRRVLVNMLQRNGYDVLEAGTPSAALEIANDPSVAIDLLVSDVVMPEMSGVELYERIRRLRPGLPVLYVSGYAHDVLTARGVGAAHLLEKPFSQKAFTTRIRSLLEG